jgi:hypothetical protein
MRAVAATLLSAAFAAMAAPAVAQDPEADPISGALDLSAGFDPDPRVIHVRGGGTIAARTIADACAGFISNAPDIRLTYTAASYPLIISVAAASDTTLVVNGPDGSWYCNDDGGVNGSNPAVRLNSPTTGRYEIWVGTYRSGDTAPARLHISEVSSQ